MLISSLSNDANTSHIAQKICFFASISCVVASLTHRLIRFHGEPPVHGPAKNTESSLVRRHRLALLIPYGESMSSSSVIGTAWNFIWSFILFCRNVNQFLSSEHNKTKHGISRGTSIKLIVRENFANLDVIKSQGDLDNWNSRVLFFFSLQRITDTLGWSTSCLPTSMWYW